MVLRKGLAKSFHQARQLVTHGHISVGERRVTVPSHLVTRHEEDQVSYTPQSPLTDPDHPVRQTMPAAEEEAQAGN